VTYNGGPDAPVNAGSYTVVATLADPNYAAAPASGILVIEQAAATITLPSGSTPFSAAIHAAYDGAPQGVSVTTSPAGVPVTVTYDGSTTAPTLPGTYHVVVTSADANYTGSVEGTFVITVTALVHEKPTLNGDLDGSLQLLEDDSFAVNSSASVSRDLLVPGTPTVTLNGHPTFVGVVDADGATAPSDYRLTLNSGAVVRYVVRRVDPIAMPIVTPVAQPTGTREVTLNKASQTVGDFATVRNLTLNGNVGSVTVPGGVYGSFTVNGNSSLVLGVAGATEPAVYELRSLTLNGHASLQIAGPVKLKLANGTTFNGTVGSAEHPEWLQLEIADGSVTVSGDAVVHAIVTAPEGSVTINGTLHGRVSAEHLTINGYGVLEDPAL
jgi:rhamnogalacturonan endolyase